jgi:tRNA G18 (ribose-2'-O)-methylase SpoU
VQNKAKQEIVLILYNVRSAYNVGSMFRTADGAGVSHIYLIGVTPTPETRFGVPQKEIAKTALGAEKAVAWTHAKTIASVLTKLKKKGFRIVALEQTKDAVDYTKFSKQEKVALIVGAELGGIPESVINKCDSVIHIPMRGVKNSLNVATAAGIALFSMVG